MKTRRSRSKASSFPVVVGVWCTIFAAYGHVACDGEDTGEGNADAGVTPDSAADAGGATVDAPDDTTGAADGDPPPNVGAFADAAGTYTWQAGGSCGMSGQSTVSLNGDEIVVNPVGTNGAVPFELKAGTTDQAVSTSTNLQILGAPGHTCTLERLQDTADLAFACTNTSGGSCTDTAKKD